MLLNKAQVQSLWEINVNILNKRSPSWILKSVAFAFVMLVVLVAVRQYSFFIGIFTLGIYFLLMLSMYIGAKYIKKSRFRKPYSYNISVLIYQAYEFVFLATFAFVAWGVGDDMIFRSTFLDLNAIKDLRICLSVILFVLILFMFVFFPSLTTQKIKRFSSPSQISKSFIYILGFLHTLPSFFAFMAIMLIRSGDGVRDIFVGGIICIVSGFFILTVLSNSLFELIIMCVNKWPIIKRDGSAFNVYDSS